MLVISFMIFLALLSKAQEKPNNATLAKELLSKSKHYMGPHQLDSALIYAEKAEALITGSASKLAGDIYLTKAEIFTQQKLPDQARIEAQKAVEYFTANRQNINLAHSYIYLANNYPEYDTFLNTRMQLYDKAAQLFRSGKDTMNEIAAMVNLACDQMTAGELDTALARFNQCLNLYQAVGYKRTQQVYSRISSIYTQKGSYADALRYGLYAVKLVEQLKDSSLAAAEIYNYLAITYAKLNQYDKLEENLRKAFALAEKNKDLGMILGFAGNLCELLIIQNRSEEGLRFLTNISNKYPPPPEPYVQIQLSARLLSMAVKTKRFDLARVYSKQLKASSSMIPPDEYDQLFAYPNLIEYHIALSQYDSVRKYLKPYYQLVQNANILTGIRDAHKFWFVVDSAKGDYLSAISHLKLVRSFSDSIYNKNKANEISALQIQYETEKKEKDIQLLTKQGQLQESRLQQATSTRNMTLAGVAVSLFFVGLLYNRYRLKQRSNQQLQLQQQEINEKNESLQHLLTEKEWLLKEVHHRIKNNLQMVMSLLNSQSAYLQNDAALTALQDSRHRIHAMSLIHQRLYTTDNVSAIDTPIYIRELVNYMQDSFNTRNQVRFEVNVTPLKLGVAQGVPLGLILNEAITNSLKYAFPEGRKGVISISLSSQANNKYLLTISDDGIGIQLNATQKSGSLGMSLMKGLSEDLDGCFEIENNNGTTIRILFTHDISTKGTDDASPNNDNETIPA